MEVDVLPETGTYSFGEEGALVKVRAHTLTQGSVLAIEQNKPLHPSRVIHEHLLQRSQARWSMLTAEQVAHISCGTDKICAGTRNSFGRMQRVLAGGCQGQRASMGEGVNELGVATSFVRMLADPTFVRTTYHIHENDGQTAIIESIPTDITQPWTVRVVPEQMASFLSEDTGLEVFPEQLAPFVKVGDLVVVGGLTGGEASTENKQNGRVGVVRSDKRDKSGRPILQVELATTDQTFKLLKQFAVEEGKKTGGGCAPYSPSAPGGKPRKPSAMFFGGEFVSCFPKNVSYCPMLGEKVFVQDNDLSAKTGVFSQRDDISPPRAGEVVSNLSRYRVGTAIAYFADGSFFQIRLDDPGSLLPVVKVVSAKALVKYDPVVDPLENWKPTRLSCLTSNLRRRRFHEGEVVKLKGSPASREGAGPLSLLTGARRFHFVLAKVGARRFHFVLANLSDLHII